MPIYAYKCSACGFAKDVLQKMSDAPLRCARHAAAAFSKQVTAAGFQLKGSGWYVTDFRGGWRHRRAGSHGPARQRRRSAKSDAGSRRAAAAGQHRRRGDGAPLRGDRPLSRHTLRKWLLSGLLVIVPLAITLGAELDHRHAGPDAAAAAGALAAGSVIGSRFPGSACC